MNTELQTLIKVIDNSFKDVKSEPVWRIRFRGRIVKMAGGKHHWPSIGGKERFLKPFIWLG